MPTISPLSAALPKDSIANIFVHADRGVAGQAVVAAFDTTKGEAKGKDMSIEEIKKVSEDFESVFLGQMLQAMVPEPEDNPLFGGNDGDETFRNMMVEEYAKTISASGGIGIASHVQQQLIALQETQQAR